MRGRHVDPFVGFRVSPPGSSATAWKYESVRPVFIYDSQFQVATDRCRRGRSPLKIAVSGCARSICGRSRDGHTRKGAPPLWLARQVLRARGRRANTNIRQRALRSCSKLTTSNQLDAKFLGNSAKPVSPCPPRANTGHRALHSITSSARASSAGGTVRPRALAVLRLMASSYLVGACTGMSAGFSPLRMRST